MRKCININWENNSKKYWANLWLLDKVFKYIFKSLFFSLIISKARRQINTRHYLFFIQIKCEIWINLWKLSFKKLRSLEKLISSFYRFKLVTEVKWIDFELNPFNRWIAQFKKIYLSFRVFLKIILSQKHRLVWLFSN